MNKKEIRLAIITAKVPALNAEVQDLAFRTGIYWRSGDREHKFLDNAYGIVIYDGGLGFVESLNGLHESAGEYDLEVLDATNNMPALIEKLTGSPAPPAPTTDKAPGNCILITNRNRDLITRAYKALTEAGAATIYRLEDYLVGPYPAMGCNCGRVVNGSVDTLRISVANPLILDCATEWDAIEQFLRNGIRPPVSLLKELIMAPAERRSAPVNTLEQLYYNLMEGEGAAESLRVFLSGHDTQPTHESLRSTRDWDYSQLLMPGVFWYLCVHRDSTGLLAGSIGMTQEEASEFYNAMRLFDEKLGTYINQSNRGPVSITQALYDRLTQ